MEDEEIWLEKDYDDLTDEEIDSIEQRIEELEKEIDYEEEKLDVCGYGTSDLMYIEGLQERLEDLKNLIY